jgi:hypothetical protein
MTASAQATTIPTLVTQFKRGQCHLTFEQVRNVKAWVRSCLGNSGEMKVDLGGGTKGTRTARLRRLNGLLHALEDSGVAARRIQPESDWVQPAPMGALDDLPADTIWLKARPGTA